MHRPCWGRTALTRKSWTNSKSPLSPTHLFHSIVSVLFSIQASENLGKRHVGQNICQTHNVFEREQVFSTPNRSPHTDSDLSLWPFERFYRLRDRYFALRAGFSCGEIFRHVEVSHPSSDWSVKWNRLGASASSLQPRFTLRTARDLTRNTRDPLQNRYNICAHFDGFQFMARASAYYVAYQRPGCL